MSRQQPRRSDADVDTVSSTEPHGRAVDAHSGPETSSPFGPTFEPVDKPLPVEARERRQFGYVAATLVVLIALGALVTIAYLATSPPVDVARPLPPATASDTDSPRPVALEEAQWPRLVPGDSGRPVRAAQLLLRGAGQEVLVTGRYGSDTAQALGRFVRQRELDSRTLDASVWPSLVATTGPKSSGDQVRALQVLLKGNDIDIAINGRYGPTLRGAVRLYQVQQGLEGTGVAGRPTWRLLASTAQPLASARERGR